MLSTAMRAPVGLGQLDSRTGYSVRLFCTTSVLDQNNGSRVELFALSDATPVFDQESCLISPPACVAVPVTVGAPPHRTGQAFSPGPCGRVACTHGDRLVAFDSGVGTTRLPCGHVVARVRVRGARRAHVCTLWR
jgi:hypothetical protein